MPSYLVAGGSRNVGLAFVRALAIDPANVVIGLNRRPPQEDIPRVHDIRADLGDLKSLQEAIPKIEEITGGALDVLILNAASDQTTQIDLGVGKEEEIATTLQRAFGVNTSEPRSALLLLLPTKLASLLLPLLRKGKEKKIWSLSSANGWHEAVRSSKLQKQIPYAATKAATDITFARLANELSSEGFTIISIAPSVVASEESIAEKGGNLKDLEARLSKMPGFSGIFSHDEGVAIMLNALQKMGPEDTGRRVGMWGSEDKYI